MQNIQISQYKITSENDNILNHPSVLKFYLFIQAQV